MAEEHKGPIGVTNIEAGDRRHLVQPYEDRPVVELGQGTVACPFCGNTGFRRSHTRFGDLLELLMLRSPVRCTRCNQRQYVEVSIALLSYPPKQTGPRPAKGRDTWQNWTSADAPVQTARPLSTALGPKARNLESVAKTPRAEPPARIPSRREDDNSIW